MRMRMSLKMENFCRAYVLSGVAKTAALEAGYSAEYARCRSHELLDHMGVRMGIESLRWEMREHNSGEADAGGGFSYDEPRFRQRYLEVLWAVGSTSLEELIVDGEMVPPEPGSLAWWAIKRWKQVPDGKGGVKPEIELYHRMSALKEFGKATGFNVPLALQPTGKMAWKGPFSPFGAATMKDAFDPPGWSEMEKAAAAAARAARQGVGGATDKNRGFGPMFEEMMAGDPTDKNRGFAGASDRGIGALPPPSGLGEPLRSDAGPASATRAPEENRGIAIGRGLLIAPPQEIGSGTSEFPGDDAAAPQRPEGRTPTGGTAPQRPEGRTPTGGTAPQRPEGRTPTGGTAPQRPEGRTPTGAQATQQAEGRTPTGAAAPQGPDGWTPTGEQATDLSMSKVSAAVARSWTEQVAMLKSAPVEVLEPLVLGILNDPIWSGRRLTSSQRQEMIAEVLQAVPFEVALKLVTRLESEEGVTVIHC